jgi:RNA polymerase-binding transcription factor DksA
MKPQTRSNQTHSSPAAEVRARPASEAAVREANTPNSCGPERIPPQWSWHYKTLLHLRDRLTRAHAEHAKEATTPPEMLGVDVTDTAQEQLGRDLLWAELGAEDDQLFEIDCALQRIREGTYGFCEETGHVIPAQRLRAVPWTRYCLAAAEQREKHLRRDNQHES